MSIGQDTDPVQFRDALLELSDERDTWLRRLLGAWADGWRACAAALGDQYERGFADGVASIKRTDHQLVDALDRGRVRWILRGQERTRDTFGQPHKDDFNGIGNGAA